jgi:TonB family protein
MPIAPPPETPAAITQPEWVTLPSPDLLQRYYPAEAAKNRIEGRAMVRCTVTAEGRLAECAVVEESPPNAGFGQAAINLSSSFRMLTKSKDGKPVDGGFIKIPIQFKLPPPAQDAGLTPPVTQPGWRRQPTAQELASAYPRQARAAAATGETTLRCVIDFHGRFETCDVTKESPAGLGFGQAALRVATLFQVAPVDGDGSKVAGRAIFVPIRFDPPGR